MANMLGKFNIFAFRLDKKTIKLNTFAVKMQTKKAQSKRCTSKQQTKASQDSDQQLLTTDNNQQSLITNGESRPVVGGR